MAKDPTDPNVFMDLALAPVRGIEGAIQGAYNLADYASGDAFLPDWDKRLIGRSETMAGGMVEGITQFATGFIPFIGVAGKVGQAIGTASRAGRIANNPFVRSSLAGAATDFTAFQEQEARLSNLIEEFPELSNPVTEFFAATDDEGVIEGRLKNAVEGLGIGAAFETLLYGLRALKRGKKAKAETNDPQEVARQIDEEISQSELNISREVDEVVETPINEIKEASDEVTPATKEDPDAKEVKPEDETFEGSFEDIVENVDADGDNTLKGMVSELRTALDQDKFGLIVGKVLKTLRHKDAKEGYDFLAAVTRAIKKNVTTNSGIRDKLTEEQFLEVMDIMPPSVRKNVYGNDQLRADVDMVGDAAYRTMAYKAILEGHRDNLVAAVKAFKADGSSIHRADIQERLEELAEFQSMYSALGAEFSKGLRFRRKFKHGKKKRSILEEIAADKAEATARGEDGRGGEIADAYLRNKRKKAIDRVIKLVEDGKDPNEVLRMLGVIADSTKGGKFDMLQELWINNILSGLPTQAANILGNSFASMLLYGERTIGHLITGRPDLAKIALRAALEQDIVFETLRWTGKAAKEDDAILLPGQTAFKEGEARHAITPEGLGAKPGTESYKSIEMIANALRLPSRGLTTADELFKQFNARTEAKYRAGVEAIDELKMTDPKEIAQHIQRRMQQLTVESGEIYSQEAVIRQGLAKAKEQGIEGGVDLSNYMVKYIRENYNPKAGRIAEYAREAAEEATFTSDLGGFGRGLQNLKNEAPILGYVMPFVRTPINIIKFSLSRSLAFGDFRKLPALLDAEKRLELDLFNSDPTIKAKAMGRVVTSTLATANLLGMLHLYSDKISGGGPVDPKRKKALEDQGWRPYSIKIGDTWVSYQRLDPLATIIGVMADIKDAMMESNYGFNDDATQRVLTTAIITLSRNVTNKSYLSGIEMLNDGMSDPTGKQAKRMLGNVTAGFIPFAGFMKHGQSVMGDQEAKEVRTITDRMLRTLPGAAGTLDPKRNLLGEKKIVQGVPVLQAISPIGYSTAKEDVVFDELAALNHSFRQVDPVYQGVLDLLQYRNEKGQSAHDRRLELIGQVQIGGRTLRQALQKLVTSKRYQKMDPRSEPGLTSPRVTEVNKILYKYRGKALKQTLSEFPELAQYHKEFTRAKRNQRRGQAMDELLQTLNF